MKENQRIAVTTGSAIGLSGLASLVGLCCIGPWAVSVLGIGGAIAMARFEPLRPWILGVAAVLLAWAFWRVYSPPRCNDEACSKRGSIPLQIALWCAACLVALAFFADQIQWLLVDPTPEGLRNE